MNFNIGNLRELVHAARVVVRSKFVRLGVVPDTIDPGFRSPRVSVAAVDELEMLTHDHEVLQAKYHRAMSGWGSAIEHQRVDREEFNRRIAEDGDRIDGLIKELAAMRERLRKYEPDMPATVIDSHRRS